MSLTDYNTEIGRRKAERRRGECMCVCVWWGGGEEQKGPINVLWGKTS